MKVRLMMGLLMVVVLSACAAFDNSDKKVDGSSSKNPALDKDVSLNDMPLGEGYSIELGKGQKNAGTCTNPDNVEMLESGNLGMVFELLEGEEEGLAKLIFQYREGISQVVAVGKEGEDRLKMDTFFSIRGALSESGDNKDLYLVKIFDKEGHDGDFNVRGSMDVSEVNPETGQLGHCAYVDLVCPRCNEVSEDSQVSMNKDKE